MAARETALRERTMQGDLKRSGGADGQSQRRDSARCQSASDVHNNALGHNIYEGGKTQGGNNRRLGLPPKSCLGHTHA